MRLSGTYWYIDECDAGPQIMVRINFVDQRMLSPVREHHCQAHEEQWSKQRKCRCLGVDVKGHEIQKCVAAHLGCKCSKGQSGLVLLEEVEWKVEPDEKEEAPFIAQEVEYVVSLVPQRR